MSTLDITRDSPEVQYSVIIHADFTWILWGQGCDEPVSVGGRYSSYIDHSHQCTKYARTLDMSYSMSQKNVNKFAVRYGKSTERYFKE